MKRSELYFGIGYLLAGILFLVLGFSIQSRLAGILFGLGGACLGPGLVMIFKYFYWTRPDKRQQYTQKLEREKIESQDELKESIRNKSGRYTYVLGLLVSSLSTLVFAILDVLEILDARVFVFYLGGYLLFQLAAGIIIFNWLSKKYQ